MKEVQLSNGGGIALVDDSDFAKVSKHRWFTRKVNRYQTYVTTTQRQGPTTFTIYLHRFIANCPAGMEVHHKDENFRNNQQSNLEVCTKQKNLSYRNTG